MTLFGYFLSIFVVLPKFRTIYHKIPEIRKWGLTNAYCSEKYRGSENIKKHKQLQRSTLHAVMTSQSAQKRIVKLGKLTPSLRCMT